MTIERLLEYRKIIVDDEDNGLSSAAEQYHIDIGKPRTFNKQEALIFWRGFIILLLESEKYDVAATFMWGKDKFTTEPQSVKDVWRNIREHRTLLIMGSAKLGKSFSAGVWLYLDWVRDPQNTSVNIISSSAAHAQTNLFAHMIDLHKSSCIPMEGITYTNRIAIHEEDHRNVIRQKSIPMKSDGKGTLRGVAPMPRKKPHPKFGTMTRIRVMMDECEFIPEGVWVDIDNMLTPAWDEEHIKIITASNPTDKNSAFGQRCEPEGGWFPIGTKKEWYSRMGFNILHLNAADSENVVQKKVVYYGFQTYEGFMRLKSEGGEMSSTFSTMGLGWFPEKGMVTSAIPQNVIDRSKGYYKFVGITEYCASLDPAMGGEDPACMSIGKYGEAEGWYDMNGGYTKFDKPKKCLQVEQQFDVHKGSDVQDLCKNVVDYCKNLSIPANRLCVDRTGIGDPIADILKRLLGKDLVTVHYSESATSRKIMEEDERIPDEVYEGIDTELYFALRKYMEFDYLKFAQPMWSRAKLFSQLSTRSYTQGKKIKLEPKKDWKMKNGGKSPDESDSAALLCHLARTQLFMTGSMLQGKGIVTARRKTENKWKSVVDTKTYLTF